MKKIAHLIYVGKEIKSKNMFARFLTKRRSNTIATKNRFLFALNASQIISIIFRWLNTLIILKWLKRMENMKSDFESLHQEQES
jgi:hypothetical protein